MRGHQDVELRLKHGGIVVVHVTDVAAHPVAGVGIAHRKPDAKQVEDGWYNDSAEQKTDSEGIARFDALARGTHSFRVQDQQTESWSEASETRQPGWMDAVDRAIADLKPDAFKGYTVGDNTNKQLARHPWRMDDEKLLYPFYSTESSSRRAS